MIVNEAHAWAVLAASATVVVVGVWVVVDEVRDALARRRRRRMRS